MAQDSLNSVHSQMVALIWNIADDVLRDAFPRGQYRDIILPMVVLRRLDALLEPTKVAVEEEVALQRENGYVDEEALTDITKLTYYNTSKWTLNRLKSQAGDNNDILYNNFVEYLNGYSDNVKDVLNNFDYYIKARKLANKDRLLAIIEKITDPYINLTAQPAENPEGIKLPPLDNVGMGSIFEELLRRFNEENNEEAGEHFTPRDVIALLSTILFEPIKDHLPPVITLYDPACGSGGMLTECREYLLKLGVKDDVIILNGTEINSETYAICKSDLIVKGVDTAGIHLGDTITENPFARQSFGFTLTNPPYGKSWKESQKHIYHDGALMDERFEVKLCNFEGVEEVVDACPRSSDGQLLFMLEEVNKMKPLTYQPQGSRIASIHNGSSLFTGDAGSGESNVRRYIIENDYLDTIIQLPNNIFYNTGIATYAWILSNKKPANRKGKVQLIDASKAFEKLRKNLGNRNCQISEVYREKILQAYMDFEVREADENNPLVVKIFDGDDFRYYSVTIERPLRLKCQFEEEKIDEMLYDSSELELSKWLYERYGEQAFEGLKGELSDIKGYLEENEISLTSKKLDALISTEKWKHRRLLQQVARRLMSVIGTDVWMDYNKLMDKVNQTVSQLKMGSMVKGKDLETIVRAMSVADEGAERVIKRVHKTTSGPIKSLLKTYGIEERRLGDYGYYHNDDGTYTEYETSSELRDTEKISVKEDVYEYFLREVRPYVGDAWINLPPTKIGCEISFNKYFYKPEQLRTLEENEQDILALDAESKGLIQSLFEGGE